MLTEHRTAPERPSRRGRSRGAGALSASRVVGVAFCVALFVSSCGSGSKPSGAPGSATSAGSSPPTSATTGAGPPHTVGASSSLPAAAAGTTTTIDPGIAHPASGVEFRSPSANIHCEIDDGPPYSSSEAFCFSAVPPQHVTLQVSGTYTTCAGETCLANPGLGELELPYGQRVALGPFVCVSAPGGMTCTSGGRGFTISRAGISPA